MAKNKSISDTFIAFDLETTGLDPSDRIIEIGAVRVQNKEIVDTYQTLINPRMHVPLEIIILTGIQEQEIKEAPFLKDVKDDLLRFFGLTPLVAHNAPFDISFLEKEAGNLNNPVIDTLKLSRILLPFINNHKLKTLYNLLENGEPAFHRALDDAIATSKIYIKFLNIIESLPTEILKKIRNIADTLTDDSLRLFIEAHNRSPVRTERGSTCGITQYAPIPSNVIEFTAKDEKHSFEASEKCVEKILSDETMLNKAGIKYEHRPEQVGLSKMVMRAFLGDEILVAEAGTGTGKTFAYLIPSILWSKLSEQRVLVSTYTKNLEDQIFSNDIVKISKTLGISFKASLIKGRNNYLCLRRWFNMLQVQFTALEQEDRYALLNLIIWQHLTQTGDISENSSLQIQQKQSLCALLSCDVKDCEMNKCLYFTSCYLAKIRKEIQDSNIVVLNHSLLLSDLNAEQKILGEYHRLIIDEAHNLERAATDFLGDMITSMYVRNVLDRLFKRGKGLLITLRETISILGEKSVPVTLIDIKKCIELVTKSKEILAQISTIITESLQQAEYKSICRLTKATTLVEELNPYNEIFFSNLSAINKVLECFVNHLSESKQRAMGKRNVDEIMELTVELNDMKERFHSLFSCEEGNMCYWVEICSGFENFKVISAPIVIGDMLKERLFDRIQTGVLVSATILVESSFDYFNRKLGLIRNERVAKFHTGTSFNFGKQVLSIVPKFLSNPRQKTYAMDVIDTIRKVILSTRRGTLILFTSYKMLNMAFDNLIGPLHQNGITLLAQGRTGPKSLITKEFKEITDSVLLGTYSFWEGIDVPGKALQNLIITKLPFPVPKEPIMEARAERLEAMGLNPFSALFIPEAIIKLRQGFGRLMRAKDDTGIILLLDNRLINRDYGKRFLDSLPMPITVSYSEEDFLHRISTFWKT